MIDYCSEDIAQPELDYDEVTSWIDSVIGTYGKTLGELCYIFCSDDYILKVNQEHLQHDYYTDIITFDYVEGDLISGDLFISLETVRSNAAKFEQAYSTELFRVIIHGVLHLCGLKDKAPEEATAMREAEEKALLILKNR